MAKQMTAKSNNSKKKNSKSKFDVMAIFKRIGKSFKDVISELKKVTQPTRKELTTYSIAVVVFVVVLGIIIYGFDAAISQLTNFLY